MTRIIMKIKREKGWLYYVDENGNLCKQRQMFYCIAKDRVCKATFCPLNTSSIKKEKGK